MTPEPPAWGELSPLRGPNTQELKVWRALSLDVWQTEARLLQKTGLNFRALRKTIEVMYGIDRILIETVQHKSKQMRIYKKPAWYKYRPKWD